MIVKSFIRIIEELDAQYAQYLNKSNISLTLFTDD